MTILLFLLGIPVILFLLVFAGIGYVVNYEVQSEQGNAVLALCVGLIVAIVVAMVLA